MTSGSLGDAILRLKAISIRHYLREADRALSVADLELRRIEKSMLVVRGGRNEESILAARSRWNERSQKLDSWRQRLEEIQRRIQGTVQRHPVRGNSPPQHFPETEFFWRFSVRDPIRCRGLQRVSRKFRRYLSFISAVVIQTQERGFAQGDCQCGGTARRRLPVTAFGLVIPLSQWVLPTTKSAPREPEPCLVEGARPAARNRR